MCGKLAILVIDKYLEAVVDAELCGDLLFPEMKLQNASTQCEQ